MSEEVEEIKVRGQSIEGLCRQFQEIVDRTEIEWLEVKEGYILSKPCPDMPASGNGPIKNFIKHLKSLDKRWLKEEAGRYLLRVSVKPFEAEIVIWIPNLRYDI